MHIKIEIAITGTNKKSPFKRNPRAPKGKNDLNKKFPIEANNC